MLETWFDSDEKPHLKVNEMLLFSIVVSLAGLKYSFCLSKGLEHFIEPEFGGRVSKIQCPSVKIQYSKPNFLRTPKFGLLFVSTPF